MHTYLCPARHCGGGPGARGGRRCRCAPRQQPPFPTELRKTKKMSATEREGASEYLTRHNFRTLVEYLTAETILNRPDDPYTFLRDLLDDKISTREPSRGYRPEDTTEYVKQCYVSASESADETGRIHPKARSSSGMAAAVGDKETMATRLLLLEKLIKASRAMAMQLDPFKATEIIVHETCELIDCDRATLFTVDEQKQELVLMVAEGAKAIRLPVGKGIAGSVAATGSLANIPDAYKDSRFDSNFDSETGYKTNTILAAPVTNGAGRIVGVIQAINHYEGGADRAGKSPCPFTDVDEEVLGILAAQAGIALHNATLYNSMERESAKVRALLDIIKSMHSNLGINSLMFTITQRAHSLVEADRCTLFLIDDHKQELWSLQGEVNIRIPVGKGIAGGVAKSGDVVNIPDAYQAHGTFSSPCNII